MRTTHDNVEVRIESLDESISEIINEVNSRNDLGIDQIIDRGEKLARLSLIKTTLKLIYVPIEKD